MRNSNGNGEMLLFIVLVVVGIVAYISFKIATALGAAFEPTFAAVAKTIVTFGLMIAFNYFTQSALFRLSLGIALMAAWPQWWPVLDSIAYGGKVASEWGSHYIDVKELHPWYMSWGFKLGVEAFIGVVTAYPYIRRQYRYRY